jgi:hypothetical protein
MPWEKESMLVLVKATPNWSTSSRGYTICTAGINENGEWRRLYPMLWRTIRDNDIKVWDRITVETEKPEKDARNESRRIRSESVENHGCVIQDREERREYLKKIADASIPNAAKEKRTLSLIKPILFGFSIEKREEQITKPLFMEGFSRKDHTTVSECTISSSVVKKVAICVLKLASFTRWNVLTSVRTSFTENMMMRKWQEKKLVTCAL